MHVEAGQLLVLGKSSQETRVISPLDQHQVGTGKASGLTGLWFSFGTPNGHSHRYRSSKLISIAASMRSLS